LVTKKTEGPAWFKVFTCNLPVFEACPPADLGSGFLAACRLLRQDEPDLDALSAPARMIFGCLREGIEESIDSYEITVLRNRRISANRKKSEAAAPSPDPAEGEPVTTAHQLVPTLENPALETETEAETDTETQTEAKTESVYDPLVLAEKQKMEQIKKFQAYLRSTGKTSPCA